MSISCSIIPQVFNKDHEIVDSNLFKDLLSILGDRSKTVEIYEKTKTASFRNWFGASGVVDENDEPLLKDGIITNSKGDTVSVLPLAPTSFQESVKEFKTKYKIQPSYSNFQTVKKIIDSARVNDKYELIRFGYKILDSGTYQITTSEAQVVAMNKILPVNKNGEEFYNSIEEATDELVSLKTVSGILNHLISNGKNDLVKSTAKLLLNNFNKVSFIQLNLVTDREAEFLGRFFYGSGKIELNLGLIDRNSKEEYHETLLHELLHAFTTSTLSNPKTEAEIKFAKTIKRIYDSIKESKMINDYGLTDHYEMVSEIMSNPKFVKELRKAKPSIFKKIIDAIREFLGFPIETNDEAIVELISTITNFINNDAQPSLIEGDLTVLNKLTTITDYTSAKEDLSKEEVELLKIHKEVVYAISKNNTELRKIKREHDAVKSALIQVGQFYDTHPTLVDFEDKMAEVEEKNKDLQDKLPDLGAEKVLDHIDDYNELANILMDRMDVTNYDITKPEDIKLLSENFRFLESINNTGSNYVRIFSRETKERAEDLKLELMDKVGEYVKTLTDYTNLEGTDIDEVTLDVLRKPANDVNILEFFFNGFGDYPRLEAQLIHSKVIQAKSNARLKTIRQTSEILEELHKLKEWSKKNIKDLNKLKKTYELLVEPTFRGRLDLVKPYNQTYYRDMNKAFKDLRGTPVEAALGKAWLRTYYYNSFNNPHYENSRYTYIKSQPELLEFYDFFKKTVQQGYDQLPPWMENSNEEKIPNLVKNLTFDYLAILQNAAKRKFSVPAILEALGTILFGQGEAEFYDMNGELLRKVKHRELTKDDIRTRMVREIRADKKSSDLGQILYQFVSFTNEYAEMSHILPEVRLIESVASSKGYISNGLSVADIYKSESSNMSKAMDMYIDAQVTGNDSKKFGRLRLGYVYDENGNKIGENVVAFSDFIVNMIKYTRLLYLGLNPFSALNNITVGLINDLIEASGGEHFTKSELGHAIRIYWGGRFSKDSKFMKLIDLIQPIQETSEHEDRQKVSLMNPGQKITDNMFIMQSKGEDFVQSVPMIAYLLHKQVECTDGKKRSLWDLFSVNPNTNKLKFDKNLAGFEYSELLKNKDREQILLINRKIHGNYSRDNASVFQPYVMYQAVMLFKKWVPQALLVRLQKKRYDYILGKDVEGRFRTVMNVLIKEGGVYQYPVYIMRSWLGMQARLNDPRPLSENEKANIKKVFSEILIFMSLVVLQKIVAPPDDEDDEGIIPDISMWDSKKEFNQWKGPMAFVFKGFIEQINRASNDVSNFWQPTFYTGLIENFPLTKASLGLMDVFLQLLLQINPATPDKKLEFRSGPRKEENKLINKVVDATPILKQANKARLTGKKTYAELTYKGK